MTIGDVLLAALLAMFAVSFLLLALNPAWLERLLRQQLRRDIEVVSRGAKNPYIKPTTDPDRFLRQLRVMAGIGSVLFAGIVVAFVLSR